MADIKTRDAVKGTIKTIDKAAIASERMKSAYAKTKDKAEQGYYAEEHSATEYAADKISYGADRIKDEGIHQFNKQGQKAVQTTKENAVRAKDKLADFKQKRAMKAAEQKKAQAAAGQSGAQFHDGAVRRSPAPDSPAGMKPDAPQTAENPLIKTRQKGKKTVKTTARNTEKAVKSTAKGTIKTAENGVKTAQATSKTAIKTTEHTAKTAQAAAVASAKTAQKAAQAAKATPKGQPRQQKSSQSDHFHSQGGYCRDKGSDYRPDCRRLDCHCDYLNRCPARLRRFPVWRRKQQHFLYASQCGGGSL